ncbi:hypothetical protein F0L68_29750 [Solihabitans fulvus]|uniref:Uncharacterized protein n=1 Tax=Solihabitans fulvus TaxID=1892852 RepID=A0A5B2WV98_9PSEU|nr:hypothetical protein [Solihabitans fulvus]KAA2254958.1 hypothetical protein F0L68_29750 [Solihabitans fulvus]
MTIRLQDGSTPRGLCQNGIIRTTGWLQIGSWAVSSGLWAALAGFFLFLPISYDLPWVSWLFAAVGFGVWKYYTTGLRPCSRAVNLAPCAAPELLPGQHFRLYGSAGPVGEVEMFELQPDGWTRIWLTGGEQLVLAPERQVWPVRLRN